MMQGYERVICKIIDRALAKVDVPSEVRLKSENDQTFMYALFDVPSEMNREGLNEILLHSDARQYCICERATAGEAVNVCAFLSNDEGDTIVDHAKASIGENVGILCVATFDGSGGLERVQIESTIRNNCWLGNLGAPAWVQKLALKLRVGAGAGTLQWCGIGEAKYDNIDGGSIAVRRNSSGASSGLNIFFRLNDGSGVTFSRRISGDEFRAIKSKPKFEYYGCEPRGDIFVEKCVSERTSIAEKHRIAEEVVRRSDHIEQTVLELSRKQIELARARLQTRESLLRKKHSVWVKGRHIGFEPASENELVILSAKLELLIAKELPSFKILEYTPKRGIDAIAEFSFPDDAPARWHFVEFEHYANSTLVHAHRFEQFQALVCWVDDFDFDRLKKVAREAYGGEQPVVRQVSIARRDVQSHKFHFSIVAVSKLEDVEIKGPL